MTHEPTEVAQALAEKRFDDAVERYVQRSQHVSFVELKRLLEPHMPVDGEVAMTAPECTEFADVLLGLLKAKRIHAHTASPMVYMIDGGMLNLPIAKTRRAMQSKKEHWLPVTFCTFPTGSKRIQRHEARE